MKSPWPEGARCVVNLTVDYDAKSNEVGAGILPVGRHSHGRYSPKRGMPRILGILDRQSVKATIFVPGYDAECYPESIRDIVDAGHEVAAHGYEHERHALGDREPELLTKTHHILTDLMGKPPVGWRNPGGGKSALTIKVLRSLGYIYDSSEKASDWPHYTIMEGEQLTDYIYMSNNTYSLNDTPFYRDSFTPPSELLEQWKLEFHRCYAEGAYFDLTIHPRLGLGSGGPARAYMWEEMIQYIKSYPNVLFQTMETTARWCLAHPKHWPTRRNPRKNFEGGQT